MSLIKLKQRLKTIQSLNSILSAMQIVTTVRLQKIKVQHTELINYLNPMKEALKGRILQKDLKKKILIVITSNRGLCGSYNSSVILKANNFISAYPDTSIVVLGKRGIKYFESKRIKPLLCDSDIIERSTFKLASGLFSRLFDPDSEIYNVQNLYKSTVIQVPTIYKLYPVPEEVNTEGAVADFILEPKPKELSDSLFKHFLEVLFYRSILSSRMGELASRLMILKDALDNCADIGSDLVISINKGRQQAITRDLLEIISSAEALKGAESE